MKRRLIIAMLIAVAAFAQDLGHDWVASLPTFVDSTLPTAAKAIRGRLHIWTGAYQTGTCPADGSGGTLGTGTAICITTDNVRWTSLALGNQVTSALPVAYSVVGYSATPTFTASARGTTAFVITLTGNVTGSTLAGGGDGQVVTFKICQDSEGARTFTWPSNVLSAGVINPIASTCSVQTFIFNAGAAMALTEMSVILPTQQYN